jgi:hypothetical protein
MGVDGTDNYALFNRNVTAYFSPGGSLAKNLNGESKPGKVEDARSTVIKKLKFSIGTVHMVDEAKGTTREYDIGYHREFTNVDDFPKFRRQLINDLAKHGISILADSLVTSIVDFPETAIDGAIKLKDVSVQALDKVGDATVKIGSKIGQGVKKIFSRLKLR